MVGIPTAALGIAALFTCVLGRGNENFTALAERTLEFGGGTCAQTAARTYIREIQITGLNAESLEHMISGSIHDIPGWLVTM